MDVTTDIETPSTYVWVVGWGRELSVHIVASSKRVRGGSSAPPPPSNNGRNDFLRPCLSSAGLAALHRTARCAPLRGLRALPPACGWADRHLGHGAPLAQAVDKSVGPDSEIDDKRAFACMV